MIKLLLFNPRPTRLNAVRLPKLLLLLLLLLGPVGAWAQNAANYAFSTVATGSLALDRNGNAVDMTTGTTQLVGSSVDSGNSGVISLPFTYGFMGQPFTQFSATSNGIIGLGGTVASSFAYTVSPGTAALPFISAFGADLSTGPAGKVHYKTVGTAPNRTLVVEFLNMSLLYLSTPANDGTFQVRLYESTGILEFVYGTMSRNAGTSATVAAVSIGFSAAATTTGQASITSSTNASVNNSATFNTNTYTAGSGAIASLNSAANGSRRVYTYVPPTGTPATPGLTFAGTTASATSLVISDNSTNEGYFKIFQSNDGGVTYPTAVTTQNTSSVATASGSQTAFVVNGLTGSTTYYYRVIAYNESGGVSSNFDASVTTAAAVPICGTKTVGPTGDYASLTAAFAALNGNGLCGPLVFELQSTYASTVETFPLAYTFAGGSATNTVTVRPQAGATGLSIAGLAASTSVLSFSGGKYLVLDGRPGGTGTTPDLTISGLNTAGNTIQFTSDANNNTVRYCQVKGVNNIFNASLAGVISFTSTATAGGGGNSNNTISNNKISAGATTPNVLVYSIGSATAGAANAGNTVSNNELLDFYSPSANASAVYLSGSNTGGNTGWTISGNSIYQTATRTATSGNTYTGISVLTGVGYTITNNFIGGASASANSGTFTLAGSFANRFIGIQGTFSTTGLASSLQGNTIRRMAVASTSGATTAPGVFAGIYVSAGDAAIGTTTGNIIGDASTASSVTVSSSTAGGIMYGIHTASSAGTISISNNTVANVAFTNANGSFYGIQGGTGTAVVTNNIVKALSIVSSSTTATTLYGYINVASPTAETITGNAITGLSIGGTGTATSHSVIGIRLNTIAGDAQVITDNTIASLAVSIGSGTVQGLLLTTGGAAGTNIARNRIYDLSAVGTSGFAYGISIASGGTYPINNNLIGDLRTPASTNLLAIAGLNITSGTAVNAHYNTINLNASSTGSTFGTSGVAFPSGTTTTLDLRDNIIVNTGTAAGTGGYAAALRRSSGTAGTVPTNYATTSNNNLFYAGTPAATNLIYVEGSASATNALQTLAAYKTFMATRDQAAVSESVPFLSTTGTDATFLHINSATPTKVESGGVVISGVASDYDNQARGPYPLTGQANGGGTAPDLGADEGDFTPRPTSDVGITALTAPAAGQTCFSAAEPVTVTLKNFTGTLLDFSVNNVTVSGTVTGPAGTTTLTNVVLTTGTLAANGTQPVTFATTVDMTTVGTYTFSITAAVAGDADATNNALPGTANTRTVQPLAPGTASVTPASSCGPTTATLTATGATGGTITWYSNADGYVTPIGTGSPFVTPSLTATTSFQGKSVCGTNSSAFSNAVTVTVTNPTVTATNTPVSRCGPGNVTLTATSSGGSTPQYYTLATGGTAFASGASATVAVTGNTTYYVGAKDNGTAVNVAGLTSNTGYSFAAPSFADYPLAFNTTSAGTLSTVDVYPTTAGTLTLQLYSGTNPAGTKTLVAGSARTFTITTAMLNTLQTLTVNYVLSAGNYNISNTGTRLQRTTSYTGSYPLTNGPISVVGSYNSSGDVVYEANTYNGFFNLTYTSSCEPATRTPIAVNVTTPPALTPATTAQTVCANTPVTVTFSSNYPTLTVSPAATATVSGQDVTFTPPATTTYTVTGTDASGCTNTATVTLTVTPLAAGTASSNPTGFCGVASGTPVLTLAGITGATSGYVWQQSATGVAGSFADIAGSANTSPFTAPSITATAYYQAVATCGTNNVTSNVVRVVVSNPQVTATNTPVARCGTGPVTLTATPDAGSVISWYDTNASNAVLATGNSYSPTVTATRQYFAAASVTTVAGTAGLSSNTGNGTSAGTTTADFALGFSVSQPGTLVSVDVYPTVAGTSSIQLYTVASHPGTGTAVSGAVVSRTFTTAELNTRVTVTLNFALAAGSYKLSNPANAAGFVRYASGSYTGTYPLASGPISVVGSYLSAASGSFSNTSYNNFFNLAFGSVCQSARTAVDVNVATPPTLTPATATATICSGSSTSITYAGYANLTVSPTTGATVSGQTVSFAPTATTAYTITGNDGTGPAGCTATATATITVNPTPDAPTLTPAAPVAICAGSSTTVTASNTGGPTNTILSVADFEVGANGFTASPNVTNPINGFARRTGTYTLGSGAVNYTGPNAAGSYYVADSDKGGTAFISTLTSPSFSTVNYTAATISVQQYYKFSSVDYAGIDYSTDNGVTWISLLFYPATIGTNSGVQSYSTYALPADALNKTQVKFRFYYEVNNDWYWSIDNVSVTGTPTAVTYAVSPPTGATVSGSTITFNPTTTTTYQVTSSYAVGCPSPATPVTITVNPLATADAGPATAAVCAGYTYSTVGTFGGSATQATYTSSGTGTFSNGGVIDGTTTSVTYSPSAPDLTAGTVTLTLTPNNPTGCAGATSDQLALTLNPTTTWTGTADSEWNNPANWSGGCVPNLQLSAVVPANTTHSISDNGYANSNTAPATVLAQVKTLTIDADAFIELYSHNLNIAGDLMNNGDVFLMFNDLPPTGNRLRFVGAAPQSVTRMPEQLYSLEVAKSSNNVSVLSAAVSNGPGRGTGTNFQTRGPVTMTSGLLDLGSTVQLSLPDGGQALLLPGFTFGPALSETNDSYIVGKVRVTDDLSTAGSGSSFGNLGLTLTPDAASTALPGPTAVVRTTGTALTGVGTSVSIKRYFDIQPATNTGLNVAMDFSYFDHERNGIAAGNVALFKSVTTTSGPWANQSPITIAANTVSKTGIADFSIWTLGNAAAPLPVELTRFEATRAGRDAVLAWTTASEKNSRGFEVQVSTDGRSYRVLSFVASATAASTAPREYAYLDREAGKAGLRYYRLRQLDLDGTATFSPVRTLRFDEAPAALSLSAVPNPFLDRLTLTISLPAALAGTAVQLTLTDAAGRIVSARRLATLPTGASEVELPEGAKLSSGVYFVQLATPGQPTQHLKVVKE